MDLIRRQVAQARRRIVLQQFISILPWCLFGALLVAVIALAIPKFWVLPADPQVWTWGWLGGSCCAGLLAATVWTMLVRRGMLDAAVEVDRRFGLKERVSSALMLAPEERSTDVGQALITDAERRVELIVVGERFPLATSWRSLLPAVPATLAFGLALLVPDAQHEQAQAASAASQQQQQIKKTAQELQKKLLQKQEEAQKKGLQDAEELFRKITQGIDDLNKKDDLDERKALVKLNDLAKELADRRDSIGDPEKMKKQFEKLKDLEKGPADKLAQAMKENNFEQAMEELKKLKEQMEQGELSREDKAKLAQQLEQMKQKLQEMVEAHREAKQDLKREIAKKTAEGDMEAVNKLQKQLDQLEKSDKQMERLESIASKCEACKEAMKSGDGKKAAAELAQLEKDLEAMQAEMDQLESINEIMDELADAKDAMRGEGDQMGNQLGMSDQEMMDELTMGPGLNEGRAGGYRPEQETETGSYDSRVRATPKAGAAVRVGDAGGPNQAGTTTEEIKAQILSSLSRESEALTEQRLPRSQQEHVKEYYQRLRKGE